MRRKHDYVPFAVKLLDLLAEKVSVKEITNEAKVR